MVRASEYGVAELVGRLQQGSSNTTHAEVDAPRWMHEQLTPLLLCVATAVFAAAGVACRKTFRLLEKQI